MINSKQSEIFINPRPKEELYKINDDPYQFNNLMNKNIVPENYIVLKQKLNEWILTTGDNIPKKLTKDWYLRNRNNIINLHY